MLTILLALIESKGRATFNDLYGATIVLDIIGITFTMIIFMTLIGG